MSKRHAQRWSSDRTSLTGVLEPYEWDDDDTVIALSLVTEEEDYIVENDGVEEELYPLIGERITVSGTVETDRHGDKYITVRRYKIIKDFRDAEP